MARAMARRLKLIFEILLRTLIQFVTYFLIKTSTLKYVKHRSVRVKFNTHQFWQEAKVKFVQMEGRRSKIESERRPAVHREERCGPPGKTTSTCGKRSFC